MKRFFVGSNDNMDINTNNLYGGQSYATMVFWKECDKKREKCAAIKQMVDNNAHLTVAGYGSNQTYVLNFPTSVSIDDIRKSVYRAREMCNNCQRLCR